MPSPQHANGATSPRPANHKLWCTETLAVLTSKSKRGCKLPTPRYCKEKKKVNKFVAFSKFIASKADGDQASRPQSPSSPASPKQPVLKRKDKLKSLENETRGFLPDINQVLENIRSNPDGFSDSETEKLTSAWLRFKDPSSPEIDIETGLPAALRIMGYEVDGDRIGTIVKTMTANSTMDKEHFMKFMKAYQEAEILRLKGVFDTYDVDGSGELDIDEITAFIIALGFIPLRSSIQEALDLVDLDGSGTLDFEEIVLLLHVYKHTEGFSMNEIREISALFGGLDDGGGYHAKADAEDVFMLLVSFFGPSVAHTARALQREVTGYAPGTATSKEEEEKFRSELIDFPTALHWARLVRDRMFESYRATFLKFDTNNDGTVDKDELTKLMHKLGYTMSKQALENFLEQAKIDEDMPEYNSDSMDFDGFVNFMSMLSQTDGFTDEELIKIDAAFDKFDADGSGDIDAVELRDVLEYLGQNCRMEEVRSYLSRVDVSNSGVLSRREFVRFFRLHREEQLTRVGDVFSELCNSEQKLISAFQQKAVEEALRLDEDDSGGDSRPMVPVLDYLVNRDLDFEEFLALCDKIQDAKALHNRRCAGYSEDEVEHYQQVFDTFDTSKTGKLSASDFAQVLSYVGIQTRTAEEQREIKALLAQSRDTCAADGLEGALDDGINFWVMLRLMRVFERQQAVKEETQLQNTAKETNFSPVEVNGFQEVFNHCLQSNRDYEDLDPDDELSAKTLPMAAIVRLNRSMGMRMESLQRSELNEKFFELAQASASPGRIDFLCFLRIMRWMMDLNFCNINGCSEGYAHLANFLPKQVPG